MSGSDAVVVDTNSLIYFFNGNENVSNLIREKMLYISAITEIELLSFSGLDDESARQIGFFLHDESCCLIELISGIKYQTIDIRKRHRIKLPDAVIAATAMFFRIPLVTFDTGFAKIEGLQLILLEL